MGRTTELEHDIVRDVDESRNRALTRPFEAFLHPGGSLRLGVEAADDAPREAAAEVGRFDGDGQHFVRRRFYLHSFGKVQGSPRHGVQVASHANERERVAAVGREFDFDARVVKLRVLANVDADGSVVGENPNAAVIIVDAEFARRTEHPH